MTPDPQLPNAGLPASKTIPGIATAALILGIVGLCIPCLGVVALILGIIALTQISKDPRLGGQGYAIFGIVSPFIAIPLIGIMSAIAIPNFIKYQGRSKQSECRFNLKAAYTAESSYFAERDAFSPAAAVVGFSPERGNRYAYFLSSRGTVQDRSSSSVDANEQDTGIGVDLYKHTRLRAVTAADLPGEFAGGVRLGIRGECPKCSITMVCAGQVDNDPTLDVWSVSTEARTGPRGELIPPGEPYHEVDDVTQ